MPDPSTSLRGGQDQTGFSRVCPSCGRRVPRSVANCRCGAELPAESFSGALPAEEPAGGGPTAMVAVMVVALLLAGAGYWFFLRPAPAPAQAETAVEEEAEPEANAAAEPSISPEARAWDATANAGGTEPGTPVTTDGPPGTASPSAPIEAMVDRVMPAVVRIETTTGGGSGFFVRQDTVLTNFHVIENDGDVTLRRMDGTTIKARVETRAPAFDIAILKVTTPSASQEVIPLASAHTLRPGQEIIVIGSAFGTLQNSVSRGLVSGLRKSHGVTLVQSDAAASPGHSGGPMLDRSGRAIGVLLGGDRNKPGVNFGVAIDHARDILEGRETNLGTGRSKLVNIDEMTPSARAADSGQSGTPGEQEFTRRAGSAERTASQLDRVWQRFRSNCYQGQIRGSFAREWFAMFIPGAIPADAAARCLEDFQSMQAEANRFREYMRVTVDGARRANVLPGTIRDLLRTTRLDFDWER